DVLERLFHQLERVRVLLADDVHGAIDDFLGDRLLAAPHHHVDEAGDGLAAVLGIGQDGTPRGIAFTRHDLLTPQPFGRLAPYLERPCLRLVTPAASSAPRTVW